jgi:hypothetical protein
MNLEIIYEKTLTTVLQKMKNDTRKEEKTGFTAPDNGLIRAVAPNIS